jgi:hypothetical protein
VSRKLRDEEQNPSSSILILPVASQTADYGGLWGYAGFLEAIHDPQPPEHAEMLENMLCCTCMPGHLPLLLSVAERSFPLLHWIEML